MIRVPLSAVRCFAALLTLSLIGCAGSYSTVKTQRPRFRPLSRVGGLIVKAFERDRHDPMAALGEYLQAVQEAQAALKQNPADSAARHDYNFAVGRIIQTITDAKLDPWSQPLRVPAPDGGEYMLTRKPDPRPEWNPALYDFTAADEFTVGGSYVKDRLVKDGIGAPLVAVGREQRANARETFKLDRIYYGVTAFVKVDANRRAEITFADPLATEKVTYEGREFPLAADFTVPLAVALAQENPKKLEMSRLLNPEKYAHTARIAMLQPYDPDKTVVLCLHGLMDSPATWTPLINTMRSDPEIRQRYQFWFYSYPSGYPYPYSAAILREQLDALEARYPLKHKMVLVGHSMGGVISRMMIMDSGDKIWLSIFGKPPAETQLSDESRKLLTEALIFKHRDEVGRAIFISAPHRGSDLATHWLGRLGSGLVRSPISLLKVGKEVVSRAPDDPTSLRLKRLPNSIDTLSPKNRFVKVASTIPSVPGIPYYSIIGDRGKGGNKDQTKPQSSDGVVPYWSSHLDGAVSELVVPSNHGAHQNPQAIAEVRRILLLP